MSDNIGDMISPQNVENLDDSDQDDVESMSAKSKSVHSLVEKKRRDKMTQYVTELADMIPMCGAMQRKLDKITVLRMAVQHIKAIKGSKIAASTDTTAKPTQAANDTLLKTILSIADGFLFVVACDRGKFLYVSESVGGFLQCSHSELIGQSIFDILHPKDVSKVKEQLVASDATAREVFIDAKTMEPVNPVVVPKEEVSVTSSGAARSFFCRMKNTRLQQSVVKSEPDTDLVKKKRPGPSYVNLHCTGFLKSWASSKVNPSLEEPDGDMTSCNLACLVAVARIPARLAQEELDQRSQFNTKPIHFYARLNYEFKFSFVEPLVSYVTGFLPQELVGNSVYEFFYGDDINHMKELLKMTLKSEEKIVSPVLSMRTVGKGTICVRMVLYAFKNPVSTELEHIVISFTAVPSSSKSSTEPVIHSVPSPQPTTSAAENSEILTCSGTAETFYSGGAATSPLLSGGSTSGDEDTGEASMAIIMGFLEADGGFGESGGQPLTSSWPM